MPEGAANCRGQQKAILAGIIHDKVSLAQQGLIAPDYFLPCIAHQLHELAHGGKRLILLCSPQLSRCSCHAFAPHTSVALQTSSSHSHSHPAHLSCPQEGSSWSACEASTRKFTWMEAQVPVENLGSNTTMNAGYQS